MCVCEMSTAVHAGPVLGYLIIAPAFVPRIFRWMAFSIIYHHHDSTGLIYYGRRTVTLMMWMVVITQSIQGSKRQCVFFLKVERGKSN